MAGLNGARTKGIFTRECKSKYVAHELRKRWSEIPNFNYKG
jgi:beta-glucuronidase